MCTCCSTKAVEMLQPNPSISALGVLAYIDNICADKNKFVDGVVERCRVWGEFYGLICQEMSAKCSHACEALTKQVGNTKDNASVKDVQKLKPLLDTFMTVLKQSQMLWSNIGCSDENGPGGIFCDAQKPRDIYHRFTVKWGIGNVLARPHLEDPEKGKAARTTLAEMYSQHIVLDPMKQCKDLLDKATTDKIKAVLLIKDAAPMSEGKKAEETETTSGRAKNQAEARHRVLSARARKLGS